MLTLLQVTCWPVICWWTKLDVLFKKRLDPRPRSDQSGSLSSSAGLLTLRVAHLKGGRVSPVTQRTIWSMKRRHLPPPPPHLSSKTLAVTLQTAPPNLVPTVTVHCSTVLWNLWEVLRRSVLLRMGRPPAPGDLWPPRRQPGSRCSSHPVQKNSEWIRLDENGWQCRKLMLLNHFIFSLSLSGVWTSALMHVSCVAGREMEWSSRRTARRGWGSHGSTAAHLASPLSSSVLLPLNVRLHLSLHTSPTHRPNGSIQLLPSGFRSSNCPFAVRWSRSGEPHIKNKELPRLWVRWSSADTAVHYTAFLDLEIVRYFPQNICYFPVLSLLVTQAQTHDSSLGSTQTTDCTDLSFCLYFTVQKFGKLLLAFLLDEKIPNHSCPFSCVWTLVTWARHNSLVNPVKSIDYTRWMTWQLLKSEATLSWSPTGGWLR